MLDVVAEVVVLDARLAPFSQAHLRSLTEILVKSGGRRYSPVFLELARATSPSGSTLFMGPRKREREILNDYARRLVKRYPVLKGNYYQPGTIDIAAMRREYEAAITFYEKSLSLIQLALKAPGKP